MASKTELPPLPSSNPATPRKQDFQGTVRQAGNGLSREPSDEYDDDYEDQEDAHDAPPPSDDDLPDTTMLDSVVLPAIASVCTVVLATFCPTHKVLQLFPRVSTQEARVALSALQRAFTDAERIIPGVTLELINEIVDSVEHVEEDH